MLKTEIEVLKISFQILQLEMDNSIKENILNLSFKSNSKPRFGNTFNSEDADVDGWEKSKIRKASLYIHPDNDTAFTYMKTNICSIEKPLVVIMVCSDTKNGNLRRAIRKTWASDAEKFNMKVLFLIGRSKSEDINVETMKESSQNKDMITEDVIDTYNNLTLKSIYMLKWMKNNCMEARFLMKVDDDTYINLKNLYEFVSGISNSDLKTFLVGHLQIDAEPRRYRFSKWYAPLYMYPYERYPPYIHGVAYLMSTQVAEKLYNQSLQNEFIYLEDVYITGICAQQIQICPTDNKLFHYHDYPISEVTCESPDSQLIVLSHHTSISHMLTFHDQLKQC